MGSMGMSEAILPRPQGLNSRGVDVSLLLARRALLASSPAQTMQVRRCSPATVTCAGTISVSRITLSDAVESAVFDGTSRFPFPTAVGVREAEAGSEVQPHRVLPRHA